MFCPNCGTQLPDGTQFCGNCGAPQNAQQAPNAAPQQPQYDPNFAPQQAPLVAPLGMKWYKFLIYFLLFAMGILNIIGGISTLTGAQYTAENGENVSKAVYILFPDLKTIDIIYGIACIALGAFQIYTRFQLAGYKKNAPNCVLGMYAATAAIVAIYSFAVLGIVPTEVVSHSELIGQAIGAIIGAGVMAFLNKIYFDKRKSLFVN